MKSNSADLYPLPGNRRRCCLLTYDEAGERSGLGSRYMQRLVREGKIAVHRLSPKKVRIAERDLDDYIESCRREPFAASARFCPRAS